LGREIKNWELKEVYALLRKIADAGGRGSQETKINTILVFFVKGWLRVSLFFRPWASGG